MASSFTRSFSFVTLILSTLLLLLLSTQIHARESYFFGKFQRDKNLNFNPVETSQKTSSVEVVPKKEGAKQDLQDPEFVPESESGYGLYGHETTYNNEETSNNNNNKKNNYNNENEEFSKHNEESVSYEPYNTPSLSQTSEESYNYDKYSKNSETYDNGYENDEKKNDNDNDKNYYKSNAYGRERSSGYNGYKTNAEKQGMSDTRFMENGKYYFDVNDENNHGDLYKKHYRHRPSGGYAVSNYDKEVGQNNNERSFYDNSEQSSFQDPYNSKWEKNMMNEQEQEEEFGGEQQDQFVP